LLLLLLERLKRKRLSRLSLSELAAAAAAADVSGPGPARHRRLAAFLPLALPVVHEGPQLGGDGVGRGAAHRRRRHPPLGERHALLHIDDIDHIHVAVAVVVVVVVAGGFFLAAESPARLGGGG
jgi:hypothetical protein